jgi:hypothetical protein
MTYEETKKMDEFVSRLFKATDFMEATNPKPPLPWKKPLDDLWGMLDDLATDMMNQIEWDEQYMDEREAEG